MVQDKEFMATLAKGLTVLGSFDKQRPAMTLSQAARVTGLSRATARRILRTLADSVTSRRTGASSRCRREF
jgi:IclR family pca regulon transcriptional regulator